MKKIYFPAILLVVGLLAGFLIGKSLLNPTVGSVTQGNEYYSTSTPVGGYTSALIKGGYGALGSVIVTTAGNQSYTLYNATTSNVTKRTGNKASSSIMLAQIPASLVAGTYTFDITFTDGLLIDVTAGTLGTSTISYR
jgi:hypothetical protein